jgi:hypothetical protein
MTKRSAIFTHAELVACGYAAPTKALAKTFELPDFIPAEDRSRLPLHIQVRFVDTPIGVNGTEEMIYPRRTAA